MINYDNRTIKGASKREIKAFALGYYYDDCLFSLTKIKELAAEIDKLTIVKQGKVYVLKECDFRSIKKLIREVYY